MAPTLLLNIRVGWKQGTLTEGERLSTVDVLIIVACFVKKKIMFGLSKAADLN